MTRSGFGTIVGFVKILLPAVIGGAVFEMAYLPLGWLMGAAVATGGFAALNIETRVPGPLYRVSLTSLGASAGLAIMPEVASSMLVWAPAMAIAGALGIAAAVIMSPVLAKHGRMSRCTAFFSLLPGGVIEMANVGEGYGADRAIVAALHSIRVGLVVGLLPLALYRFAEATPNEMLEVAVLDYVHLIVALSVGLLGGWVGSRLELPAGWLLGALIMVGLVSSTGAISGRMPDALMAIVQVFVGMSLGARFQRSRLAAVSRALVIGLPAILVIMAVMALVAVVASFIMPFTLPTLVLCFSIGGMAEMVLTSKALGQNVALVAAFQAVRGVVVNAFAGAVWRRIASFSHNTDTPKG
jgi:hypothetical protein